ncbi:hypothetical protein R2F25_15875 [Streptomyces sp. UP1A-1]|nr:hypothetical protein [Streptomyces sp. UP1A-1]
MRPPATPRERSVPEPAPGPEATDGSHRAAPTPPDAPETADGTGATSDPAPRAAQEPPTPAASPEPPTAVSRKQAAKAAATSPDPTTGRSPQPPTATATQPPTATASDPVTAASQESAATASEEASVRPGRAATARAHHPSAREPSTAPAPTTTPEPSGSAPEPPVTDLSDLAPAAWPARAAAAWPALPLLVALALWVYATRHTDVSALDDFGLVSALYPTFWAGLAVLTAGFWFTVRDRRRPGAWSLAYVLVLLVMERATQALLYPTPLYAWAWKHDAVIDHLLTSGGLQGADRLGDMAVYDQWPGFFAAQAALVRLLGVDNAAMYMAWWPLVSSVLLLLPLLLIYRTFTEDRRLIWTAVWLFCVGNWVGQDYFSPQSVAFALHLGVLAVVLRRYGRSGGPHGRAGAGGVDRAAQRAGHRHRRLPPADARHARRHPRRPGPHPPVPGLGPGGDHRGDLPGLVPHGRAALPVRRHAGHDPLHRRHRRQRGDRVRDHAHRHRCGGDLLGGPAAVGLGPAARAGRCGAPAGAAAPRAAPAADRRGAAADVRGEQLRQRDDLPGADVHAARRRLLRRRRAAAQGPHPGRRRRGAGHGPALAGHAGPAAPRPAARPAPAAVRRVGAVARAARRDPGVRAELLRQGPRQLLPAP